MAEMTTIRLDADSQMLLDQPLLRLPHEQLRKNFKTAQRQIELTSKNLQKDVQMATAAATGQKPTQTLASLEATLAKAQSLKRKLEALHAEEQQIHRQQRARIQHLQQLHEIPSLADVKYDKWSHTRLDRLLVDYLLRQGYTQSAKELASEKDVNDLVDIDVFEECGRIEDSLRSGRTQECLGWCGDNKQALKKINSKLELELRLQQCIELARSGKQVDAIFHARRFLASDLDPGFGLKAAGLLAHPADTLVEPYQDMYNSDRYAYLAEYFVRTHHELFNLPTQPLIHIALSAGLSALKTPTCHSQYALQASANTGAPVCPICSTELNELARNVPYAHHTKSYMEEDPVVLPNGRVFGRERLNRLNEKLGTRPGRIKDPTDMEHEWDEKELKKVYIS
ncbi:Protein fyv10 [Cercospora zeina]